MCRRGLTQFDAAYAYGEYSGSLRKLIHLFKYSRVETLAGPLGGMLALALPREQRFDVIVPLPLHWTKRWQRGFNQAALLACEVSRRTGVPVRHALRRTRRTPSQAGLSRSERRGNVRSAFQAARGTRLDNLHVLIIDDVLTTGATLNAASAALKKAGAGRITVMTVARADRRGTSFARFAEAWER